ncbi:MAG: N-acetylglucosamine-6-phosphate deacetylase [Actinomycetia bacterium]|nr:N-acetylglucosamine-6-phosphate deacetylase [Actinomycetes bacterium]
MIPGGRAAASGDAVDAAAGARGLVDLQVNGVGDVDFAAADPAGWSRAGAAQAEEGVRAYCPTFVTAPLDHYAPWLERMAAAAEAARADCLPEILGAHLEGPFLGGAPGAHPVELIRPVDLPWLERLLDGFPGLIRIVTLAPEADPGLEAVGLLRERGVVVALGHSRCSYEEALAAADAGATLVTHLFNGMGPLHHRDPGLPGAALDDDRLIPTLIADLVHVHPVALRLALARKDCILVTDAVATGAGVVGELAIVEHGGAAYLDDGTLAGSVLTLRRAVRNVADLGVDPDLALDLASTLPLEILAAS